MKSFLPIIACLFLVTAGYAQIKGNPKMQGNLQQLNLTKVASKLSPDLKTLKESNEAKPQIRALATKPLPSMDGLQNLMQIKGNKVLVDFTVKDNVATARKELEKAGVTITAVYGRVISGYAPINALQNIETVESIRYARPSYKPMHQPVKPSASLHKDLKLSPCEGSSNTGVVSQGDTAMLSYKARKKFDVNGKGVKVGILSDSYNNLGTADVGVRHGELPGRDNPYGFKNPVQVVKDLDSGGTDEGRQMLEIVHDVAPGSHLAFYTAYDGEADFAQGIQTLADKGCKVIGDDIFYYDEPFFQDGIIAQSVDVAKQRGVTYFSAAGNQSIKSYQSIYRPSSVEPFGLGTGTAHNFVGHEDAPVFFQPLYVPIGGQMIISFQWDQSSFAASGVGATTDFDVYLTDINGNIVTGGFSDNIASGEPIELVSFLNNTSNYTFFLTIVKYAGPDVSLLKYILYGDALFYLTDPPIPGILAPTLVGHTKAEGAISTGAAFYLNTPPYGLDTALVEPFSSVGGVPNFFDTKGNRILTDIRKKPEIVAPDGGNVSFSYYPDQDIPEDADTFPNFFGTSAATPHAAGVAALMIEAQRLHTLTPDQIKGELEATASKMTDYYPEYNTAYYDFNSGHGFINAEKAVERVHFPNLYVKDLKLKPLCSTDPSSERNWKISNPNPFPVEAHWFVEGNSESGTITLLPGDTSFTTRTVTFENYPVPNVAVLSWKDNFNLTRLDIAFSTRARCGVDNISEDNSDEMITKAGNMIKAESAVANTAEVYPNPASKSFKLYLSLAGKEATTVELYSAEGKKLQSKMLYQSNGVVDIDASGYTSGVYLLTVRQGKFFKTIRVIKE